MVNNYLITGTPGSGKTTVVQTVVERLKKKGFVPGGVYCPEIREGGSRKGFEMVDVMTGKQRILAHVDREEGPSVSRYGVNVDNVDAMSNSAIGNALEEADFLVIDEIAPMEIYSDEFRKQVKKALDSEKPLLAVIHKRSSSGFIGGVKEREDVRIFEVNQDDRDDLPSKLSELVLEDAP